MTLVGGEVCVLLSGYDIIPQSTEHRLPTIIALPVNGRDTDVLQPCF